MKSQTIHKWGGTIEFYREDDGSYYIEDLNSSFPGGGKAVVAEFRKKIGKNQRITADIIESETRKSLLEMGLLEKANKPGGRIVISDAKVLSKLKIVRVFRGGGIKIDRLVLGYESEANDEDMEMTFYDGKKVGINLFGRT